MADDAQQVLSLTPAEALAFLVREAEWLAAAKPGRVAIGIAGGPGTGKSTLTTELVESLNARTPGHAAYVAMDGFHMLQAKLESLGTAGDKGAPHTFEGEAFAAFLGDLKAATGPVSGPGYSREIEDVVPDQFIVPAEARLLVVEGNYLLLPDPPWGNVRPQLHLSIFIAVPRDKVRLRLLKRRAEHGRFPPETHVPHVDHVDLPNYDLVQRSRPRADIVIDLITDI